MGRQYVRQSFSSASCAAGDSPCASSTTLQCVVANTPVPWTLSPVALTPVNGCSAGDTLQCNQKIVQEASLDWTTTICPTSAQIDTGAGRSLWRMLSL